MATNSRDGNGLFNWRYKFMTEIPAKLPRLQLQIWDEGLVGSKFISEAFVDLRAMFDVAYRSKETQNFNGKRLLIPCSNSNFPGLVH